MCHSSYPQFPQQFVYHPEISTDGWHSYKLSVRDAFRNSAHGVIVKTLSVTDLRKDAAHRYSPCAVVAVSREVVSGVPAEISTSYIERSNLTVRMASRRFTRLTNGFSKKLESLGGRQPIRGSLQLVPTTRITYARRAAPNDTSYGAWTHRSRLVDWRTPGRSACSRATCADRDRAGSATAVHGNPGRKGLSNVSKIKYPLPPNTISVRQLCCS